MRILLVEDEKKVAKFIQQGLEEEHYSVDVANDGERGLQMATNEEYDLLILDVMLPKMSGLELIKSVRAKKKTTPTLMLTAKTATEDKVAG
ncbi:MAG: response regulator, partial [bacterium]